MKKQKPAGTIPYDFEWNVGESGCAEELSPYPRVNRLLDFMHAQPFMVDPQRALLVTEGYKKFAADSTKIKWAKSYRHILENVNINIYPDELFVGEIAAPMKSAPIFPEIAFSWICDEIRNHPWEEREVDPYSATDETRQALLGIEEFWKGKTSEELAIETFSPKEMEVSHLDTAISFFNLYLHGGVGHTSVRYERVMEIGYGGVKKQVEEALAKLDPSAADYAEQKEVYDSMLIALDGCHIFMNRYAKLAKERAAAETSETRKAELLKIAEVCEWVSENPPRDFYDALQLFTFATNFILIESNGHSISYGRFDQYLYPFYEKSLENGATQEALQELLEVSFVKMLTPTRLRDHITAHANSGRGMGGESLTIGGVDKRGKDASNDLTYMVLDASAHTRLIAPWVCVRLHNKTPYELKVKTANVIRIGYGHPKVFNDEVAIPASLASGRTLADSRDYQVVGCVEIDTAGKEYGWHDATYFSMSKVLEMAMNDGKWLENDRQSGPQTGSLKDFTTFEELQEAFDTQMEYWVNHMVTGINKMDEAHAKRKPLPYLSALMDGCIEKGKDVTAGGAIYNFTGPQAVGLGTVADGLSVLKKLVFEDKAVSGETFLEALKNDWEGHEALYQLVNSDKMHHYGNDDDYADDLAIFAFNSYCDKVDNKENPRGGTFLPGVYSVSANVPHGQLQWASPEGRKAHEPVSDCLGPVHTHVSSHDISGPTAIAKSVGKLDHERAGNGTLLNWKFTPATVSGITGRNNFVALLDEIVAQKIMHSQFNITNKATLLAALENPEKYKNMLVRVAGYSAYFVELSPGLQQDIIARTELSFE